MDDFFQEVVTGLNGEALAVPIAKVLEDPKVAPFFMKMFKPKWSLDTLAVFFQSRPEKWEFDAATANVKIKSALTAQILEVTRKKRQTAPLPMQLYEALLRAGNLAETLSAVMRAGEPELGALPTDTIEAVLGTLGSQPETPVTVPAIQVMISGAGVKVLSALPAAIEKKGPTLGLIMDMYKLVVKFGGDSPAANVAVQKIATLRTLCELAYPLLEKGLGSVGLVAISLLCQTAPIHVVALAVAGLGEKGESEDIKTVAGFLAQAPAAKLEGLPSDTLLRLATAATKSSSVAEAILGTVATAAAATLSVWSLDDMSKLLLALAKAKSGGDSPAVASLYGRAAEALFPKLATMSDMQLIKVTLAVSKVTACKEFLEAVAAEAAGRLANIAPPQLLLLTQGLATLGGDNASFGKILDVWAADSGESTGQLSGDQAAKLAQTVAPLAPGRADFWAKIGQRLVSQLGSITDAGKASAQAAFPDGGGPDFPDKAKLLEAVKPPPPKGDRDRDRGDRDGKKRSRSRGGGDRDRDRGRDRDRDRDRDRGDRDRGDRDRGDRDRGDREEKKKRSRSRSRKRSRSRSRDRRRR